MLHADGCRTFHISLLNRAQTKRLQKIREKICYHYLYDNSKAHSLYQILIIHPEADKFFAQCLRNLIKREALRVMNFSCNKLKTICISLPDTPAVANYY